MLRLLCFTLFIILSWPYGQAQSPSHRPSENFRPQQKIKTTVLSGAQDGELTLEEYHRRRLIHEAQQEKVQNTPDLKGLDREIDRAFKTLMNPASMLGKAELKDDSELERQARINAELDRQIERSRLESERWEQKSETLLAQVGDEDFEADYREIQKIQQDQLKKLENKKDVSPQEMRELLRAVQGPEATKDIPPEYVDTMAENLFLALAPIRQMSEGEFKQLVTKALDGKPIVSSIDADHPVMDVLSDLARDPQALPNLGLITHDKSKLIKFIIANVILFVLALVWKSRQKKSFSGFFSRFRGFMIRNLTMTGLRLGVLVFFYGALLSAGFNIIRSHF